MTAAPSMAEVLAEHLSGDYTHLFDADPSSTPPEQTVRCRCGWRGGSTFEEHQEQALAAAGFGHVASVEADSLRVAALAHAIECYAGPDDDTLPVLRWWLTQLRAALDGATP